MITPSRLFQLRHPWLTLLFVFAQMALGTLLALLPVWGWIHLRFSPVQRYYLASYMNSSVGTLVGEDPESAEWIEKSGPGKAREIAQPEDLVPGGDTFFPFQLSQAAQAQGWKELDSSEGKYRQQDIRDYLEANVYDGHSFWFLVLQPLEPVLFGWLCWRCFGRWRKALARERGLHWDPHYRPSTLDEDLQLFVKQTAQETKTAVRQLRAWAASKQQSPARSAMLAAERVVTDPPSQTVQAAPSIANTPGPKPAMPGVMEVIEVVPVQSAKPVAPATDPGRLAPSKLQPELKSAPGSPFGKSERQWDLSQWVD